MLRTTGTGPVLAPKGMRRQDRPIIHCVYLTTQAREAEVVAWLVAPRRIEIYRASSVREASDLLAQFGGRVLLSETSVAAGGWTDALRMVRQEHPEVAMVVALAFFDGQAWVEALEQGCYDVLAKPFNLTELRNGLEDAYWYAVRHLSRPVPPPDEESARARRPALQVIASRACSLPRWRQFTSQWQRLGRRMLLCLTGRFRLSRT